MSAQIIESDFEDEYFFKEGCHILELENDINKSAMSIARVRVEPGKRTKWHALKGTEERYVILDGIGRVEVDDMPPTLVSEGDVIVIPAGNRQRIQNMGTIDLLFLAICTPRFEVVNYINLEAASKAAV